MSGRFDLRRVLGFVLLASFPLSAWTTLWAQSSSGGSTAAKSGPAPHSSSNQSDPVVLSLKDRKVTASEFDQMWAHLPLQQRRQYLGPGGRRAFADYLGQLLILAEAAQNEKLDRRPDVAAQLNLVRAQVLAFAEQQAILSRVIVSEDQVQEYYSQNKGQFVELHLLHISIPLTGSDAGQNDRVRKEMDELRQRALKGENFQTLARQYSKDSDSAQDGDLGFLGRGKFGEAIDNIVFKLKPGEVSEVFDAPGSVHLFKALAERAQPLSDAREAIVEALKNQMLQLSISSLIREGQSSVNEEYFAQENDNPLARMPMTVQVEKDGKPVNATLSLTPTPPAKEKKK